MDGVPNMRAGIGSALDDDPTETAQEQFVIKSMGLLKVFSAVHATVPNRRLAVRALPCPL